MLIKGISAIVDTEAVQFYQPEIEEEIFVIHAVIRGERVPLGQLKEEGDIDKLMNWLAQNKFREVFFNFDTIKGVLEIE